MEFLLLTLTIFCFYCWGVYCGWKAREEHAAKQLDKFLHNAETHIKQEMENMTRITIEKHNNVFYVYDLNTNEFMAQGSSREELEAALHSRYPDKKFACNQDILEKMGFTS
jgi:predicted small metal-binding protein